MRKAMRIVLIILGVILAVVLAAFLYIKAISYFVKDPESSKNELLGKAVADARGKASVLTSAAGVVLKDIQSIDYSWGEINFEYQPMGKAMPMENCLMEDASADRYDMNLEPDNIEVSDTVTVIWEIC